VNWKLLSIVIALAIAGHAQTVTGVIGGVVTDPLGAPIRGAAVSLKNDETGEQRTVTAGSQGEFTFAGVAPGRYTIAAEQKGFQNLPQHVILEVNQEIQVPMPMVTGSPTTVNVEATPVLLNTETSAIGGVIDNRTITGIPLDGRDFYQLSLLLPGVFPPAQGSAGSVRGAFTIEVNGAREDANVFLLDGVYNGDPKLNGVGVTPPVDAIREFEVEASTYDATFGRNAGGQVSVVTQSGTNQVHGVGYEFFSNAALNARNFFDPANQPDPAYRRNQFGATIGAPIKKNRTFFFGDFQITRLAAGQTQVTNVPTAQERVGNFANSGLVAIDPTSGQPIPGNALPPYYLNSTGLAIAALYPLPNYNAGGANYVSSPIQTDHQDQFDIRVDHAVSSKEHVFARFSFVDDDLFTPFGGSSGDALVPGYGLIVPSRAQNAALGETRTFTPTLLNEVRLAFNRVSNGDYQQGYSQGAGTNLNQQVGIPNVSGNPRDLGLSLISVDGFSPIGDDDTAPEHGTTNTYQFADNATWIHGQHIVKFGTDIRVLQENAYRDVEARGFLEFEGIYTGNPLEELLLGLPTDTGVAVMNNPEHLRSHSLDFFVNDTWRIRPNLTLTAGLRYEYNSPAVDASNNANLYNPATGSLVPVGQNGFPAAGYNADYHNFAPQLGIAWSPKAHSSTVVRAAYGIHYDQSSLAPGEGLYFSAPYYNLNVYFPIEGVFTPSLSDPFPSNFPYPYPASATAFQRNLQTPYYQQWNFGIQQQIGKYEVLEVAYVGTKGTHLIDSRDINQPQPSTNPNYERPNPEFADINIVESAANSIYHSLQARFQQRLFAGATFLASYTYSKSIDDASGFFSTAADPNFPQNSYDLSAERGRSDFDIRHRFVESFAYDLPIARGHRWLGGWQTFGVITLQTGQPFTVALLPDDDNANVGQGELGFGANQRPNVVGKASLPNPGPAEWFNTAAFAPAPYGQFGNAGRNILSGPGVTNIDFSIVKNTKLAERLNMQFRAEFFDLFNTTNFNLPDSFLGSATFGQILSAQAPRRIQFGLKFRF
jgi:hypothetical protein